MLSKIKKIYDQYFLQKHLKIVYKNQMFLLNGEYSISNDFKVLYLNDKVDLMYNILNTTFNIKKNTMINENKYRYNNVSIEKNHTVFPGEMMMLSTSNYEMKFFDFRGKKILTKFIDKKKFEERTKNMLYFSSYFPLPNIYSIDYEKKYYIEKIIEKGSKPMDCLNDLYNKYIDYFSECYHSNQYKEIDVVDFKNRIKDKYLKKAIINIMNERKILKIPCVKMHGDLWKSNILVSENEYYLIDWEWSDKYSIYYDYFTFILNEATLNHDKMLLKSYFKGNFDEQLEACGKIFGYKFLPKYKREYFIIFLCEMSVCRWKGEFSKVCPDIIKLMKEFDIY